MYKVNIFRKFIKSCNYVVENQYSFKLKLFRHLVCIKNFSLVYFLEIKINFYNKSLLT